MTARGCIRREEVDASIWLETGLPPELCERMPELKEFGRYRKLDSGKYEFSSYCAPNASEWLSMFNQDFEKLMNKAGLPKQ